MSDTSSPGAIVLLTRLSRLVYRSATGDVLGMRMKQFMTLNQLRDHGPLTQQALSEVMCVDANTCVLLLNEAEAAGHARRVRDPRDRRRHIVEITDEGRTALKRAERGMESVEDEILGELDAADRATLRTLLARALEDEDVAPRDEVLTQAS
ncbi:MarR family winged helix-turn-helix transcriptional regulator [Conexibacter sp. CPCC 206217]|uniref:MarR family winged helix-turn-helix transcriptional regulator n=1 Tax=Conexibacter sp. CPCC 206217 TaxID=3064574 RepID=UPI002715D866|nr:MarR family transcriptional regulator [Conexibacter sp. CPCC 206217]MDO8212250.1 MarR family transcriptional regulator [Conexibacter sp. CPCC 206217]